MSDTQSDPSSSAEYLSSMEQKIFQLENQVRQLGTQLAAQARSMEGLRGKIPDTAIISPSFTTRAFAVWGHMFVAQLMIVIPLYCIIFGISLLSGSGW